MLKGEFAVKTKSSLSGYWRYAAIFVAICFVTQLAYDAARLMHYQRVVKSVQKCKILELYKSLFS
jgi:general secretion pathway protein L